MFFSGSVTIKWIFFSGSVTITFWGSVTIKFDPFWGSIKCIPYWSLDVPNICEQSLQLRKHQGGTHQQQQQHQVGTHQQQQQRQVGTLLIFLCGAIFGCCKNKIKKDRSKRSMKVVHTVITFCQSDKIIPFWSHLLRCSCKRRDPLIQSCYVIMELFSRSYWLPNCRTSLAIIPWKLSQLFWQFINVTAYHLARYEPSSPSTKDLPALVISPFRGDQ